MDPRRVWELNEAAAKGAARRAAADAAQRSVQGALRSERERRQSQDIEMFDAPPLSSSYGSPQMVSDNGRTAPSGLERVVSHSRSGILSDSKSLGRLLSSDSAISLASGSPSCIQQEPLFRPSAVSLTAQTHNRRQHSKASGSGQTSGALQQLQPQARHTVARVPQLIDLDSDSPLPLRHRVQQPANNGLLRIGNPAIVDITGDSPPVQAPTRRFTNRIDLERIGSHTLASTSSCCTDPWAPQNTRQPARNRSQHTSSIRDDWDSAVDLVDMPFEYSPVGNVESQYRSNSSAANRSTRGQPSQPRNGTGTQRSQQLDRLCHQAPASANDMSQEDLDLALAMSLAAEDEEESLQFPLHSSRSTRGRGPRQQHFATRPRPNARPAANLTDPFAALHPTMLLGNSHAASHADHDTAYAMMAALMADFVEPSGVSHIGGQMQDMSYEALTNLEDVKLTAPPELLATMPLDMCLKGSQWEDKACSVCQCEYEPDDVIMILPCEHHFHRDCISEWLSKHSKKCPICKESIGG